MKNKEKDLELKKWNKDFFNKRQEDKIDFYHLNTSIINDVFPVDVGHEVHTAADPDIENKFPYFLLHFVVKGKGSILINGVKYDFGKNDLFILPANVNIAYFTDKTNPWEYYWINFNGLLAKKLTDNIGLFGDTIGITLENNSIKKYFVRALDAKNDVTVQPYVVTECLFGIFGEIAKINHLNDKNSVKDLSLFQKIYDYVVEHIYDSDLTAKKISSTFFINPCYFSTLFTRNANLPFKQYVNYERIKKATVLLETTDMLVKEIAETVGFVDPLYFSKIFKKYRLVSPEEYRISIKSTPPPRRIIKRKPYSVLPVLHIKNAA